MAVIMNDPTVGVTSLRDRTARSNVEITPQKPPDDLRRPARTATYGLPGPPIGIDGGISGGLLESLDN